jgi:hypothetical protein
MEMDDQFLKDYRRDPAPGYARRLRETLRAEEDPRPVPVWRPLAAVAAVLALVATLFMFPAVRAGAQAMLDLFRVRTFVAVPFQEERFEKLRSLDRDNAMLVFDHHDMIQEPGPPVVQPSPTVASALVGYAVETPAFLPDGLALDTVAVTGEGRARLGVSTARLRELLAALDLRDVEVPPGLDGQDLEVHMHRVVSQRFSAGKRHLALLQSRSPEVTLPTGVDLQRLGEIGLRILGLDAGEAQRIAATVDWRSTLMVPVPANASSFRSVTVQGNPGLLITTTREGKTPGERRHEGTVVLWTEGDRVFALEGTLGAPDMIQVAESVR